MSWKGFFEGIQEFSEDILFAPFEALRFMELDNWWAANVMSWLFLAIGFVAFMYWMRELARINARGEEDRSQTSHSYLG
ncbi:MAG: uracil phosphoribosyltransferase [Flavobacteriaceae bacterium]|nr:uracil phosphoribosyltransferase [Flavobacteriaceae bacterium]